MASHRDRHSGQRRLGRALLRRGAVLPPLLHERDLARVRVGVRVRDRVRDRVRVRVIGLG